MIYRGSQQYRIRARNETANELLFWYGGYQSGGWAQGGPWFVENVKEELDCVGEWFLDEATQRLYVMPNGTHPADALLEGAALRTLVSMQNVEHLRFEGLDFRHTAPTFLDAIQMPSDGDYRIYWGGAVEVRNSSFIGLHGNTLLALGGQGVFVTGTSNNVSIQSNEMHDIGESAIVLAGDGGSSQLVGAVGQFPSFAQVQNNYIHDIGLFGKQSACVFQSLACGSTIRDNVCAGSPRHGVNLNDHFAGGTRIVGNLLFNTMRESRVGGPFNDWDRSAFYQPAECTSGPTTDMPQVMKPREREKRAEEEKRKEKKQKAKQKAKQKTRRKRKKKQ